jgi:hypothetical protein
MFEIFWKQILKANFLRAVFFFSQNVKIFAGSRFVPVIIFGAGPNGFAQHPADP